MLYFLSLVWFKECRGKAPENPVIRRKKKEPGTAS
jgi:hypothetical protein